LVVFTRHILQKAQISKFKTKESEHTHHFMLTLLLWVSSLGPRLYY
ncbi:MAG: hypothetical protein ACI8Y3_001048, partial [Paraglaciecola sp.]